MAGKPDVLVIGAGIAGLNCAALLTRAGHLVDVIEASDDVGGRIRTDVVDGYRCDRGFQLINPSYPAAEKYLDLEALRLSAFRAGVAVAGPRGLRVVADPLRAPRLLARTVKSGYLRPIELLRLARWAAPALSRVPALLAGEDISLAVSLDRARATGRIRSEILTPFLTGVLAEDQGRTSATFALLLVRSFLLGTPGVPADGMAAIPRQLAARLTAPVRVNVRATAVNGSGHGPTVTTDDGVLHARAVVVATDPTTAGELLPLPVPDMKGLVTYWFAAPDAPTDLRLLVVEGSGSAVGPVVNTAVMSNAAPTYAPAGRHLIQATTLARRGDGGSEASESEVRRHLVGMYGVSTSRWDLLIRHDIRRALPEQLPPLRHRQPVDLGDGVFVAGDHRDTASIQGALVSGRRAADGVSAYLRR